MPDALIERFKDLIRESAESIAELHAQGNKTLAISSEDFRSYYGIADIYELAHRIDPELPQTGRGSPISPEMTKFLDGILAPTGMTHETLQQKHRENSERMARHLWANMLRQEPRENDTDYAVLHECLDTLGLQPGSKDITDFLGTDPATFHRIDQSYAYNMLTQIAQDNRVIAQNFDQTLRQVQTKLSEFVEKAAAQPQNIPDTQVELMNIDGEVRNVMRWSGITLPQVIQSLNLHQTFHGDNPAPKSLN
jgi:hypothetical protein